VLDKTGSLPVSFPLQIIYRIVSYRIYYCANVCTFAPREGQVCLCYWTAGCDGLRVSSIKRQRRSIHLILYQWCSPRDQRLLEDKKITSWSW